MYMLMHDVMYMPAVLANNMYMYMHDVMYMYKEVGAHDMILIQEILLFLKL